MTDSVHKLLSALVHGKSADDYVFTRANGNPVRDFRGTWQKACAHAGVPELLFTICGEPEHGIFAEPALPRESL